MDGIGDDRIGRRGGLGGIPVASMKAMCLVQEGARIVEHLSRTSEQSIGKGSALPDWTACFGWHFCTCMADSHR